jgi:hypothetical protein
MDDTPAGTSLQAIFGPAASPFFPYDRRERELLRFFGSAIGFASEQGANSILLFLLDLIEL